MTMTGRLVILFALLATSRALAGAVITLVTPDSPEICLPGASFPVDVLITTSQPLAIRQLSLDFSHSNAALGLSPQFEFDFSTIDTAAGYAVSSNLPQPSINFTGGELPMLETTRNVPFHIGSLMITTPTAPGAYILDAANFYASSHESGARIVFDANDEQIIWSTFNDGSVEITGGAIQIWGLFYCPEPTTLAMLALGIIPLVRRPGSKRGAIA